jgi:hypothetical protein
LLQYADDIVICIQHDPEKAINLKLLLYIFGMMYGLKNQLPYRVDSSLLVGIMRLWPSMLTCLILGWKVVDEVSGGASYSLYPKEYSLGLPGW